MKTVLMGLLALIGVAVALVLIWGTTLPVNRQGSATRLIAAPAALVMAVLKDVSSQPGWRPDVRRIEMSTGSHQAWTEHKADGDAIQFWVNKQSPNEWHLGFESPRGYSGQWSGWTLETPQGTQINVTEDVKVPSLMGRILSRWFFDPEKFSQAYLQALETEVQRRMNLDKK
jgi:hypothetical protein